MSSSAFAGNPLFISPELLSQDGLLRATDFPEQTFSEYLVDFPIVTAWKSDILHKAWKNFQLRHSSAEQDKFFAALQEKYIWLREYSLLWL